MSHPTAFAKVSNYYEKQLHHYADQWADALFEGDLLEVENQVHQFTSALFDRLMASLLISTARKLCQQQKKILTNVVQRPQNVVLRTGTSVSVPSLYHKRVGEQHQGSRHLVANHWGLVRQATPARFSLLTYCTMIAPSYDMAKDLLDHYGIACTVTGLRDLTNEVATTCSQYGEAELQLEAGESLAGKRVVISDDGGRTRTRLPNGMINEQGREGYTTPWREPKLFVIEVLDDQGRLSQHHLPIYGCRFGDVPHVELLRSYLLKLDIHLAKEVQLVADGASWIWKQIPPMLEKLGVPEGRLIQTLDYYHAVEHLNTLFENLPFRIGKKHAARLLKRCKEWLWEGKTGHILRLWAMLYKRKPRGVKTEMNYLAKHADRMQYATFKDQHLMCGSGVIESAIRRVINLRFKNTGTFWYPENVEQLYFLRGAVLSKRWKIVVGNLAKRYF